MRSKFLLLLLLVSSLINAQSIDIIPNPSTPDLFAWSGSGALSGYAGSPIALNNLLITQYNPTDISDPATAGFKLQLAVYNGSNYQLIANPDNGPGVYYQGPQIIFNNKMFFIYINAAGIQQLASFDGTSITLYANPDAGLGYIGSPRIYNNELYGAYNNVAGIIQFGRFTGTGLSLIANPDNSTIGFNFNYATVFNNRLVARYVTEAGPKNLATFDGTSWTILPNPDNTPRGVYPDYPTIYHNKIYWEYSSETNQYQLLQFDGVNNPSLIANPQNSSVNNGGITGFPIISQDTLFYQYFNTSDIYQLLKFDGTTLTLVPNPDSSPYGYWWKPAVFDGRLYILYQTADNIRHLAAYEPVSNSISVYANPDAGTGYWDYPIVYDNKLYMMYLDASSQFRLSWFDNTSIHLVDNPAGIYNSTGYNGYMGSPLIFNNLLYLQYGSVPYNYAGNLATLNETVLPLSFLGFDGILKNDKSVLTWHTANELYNKGFEVERSNDGIHFTKIGFVSGKGNNSRNDYSFTDQGISPGSNYYRLKQVDVDDKFVYSSVIRLEYKKFSWSISGNSPGEKKSLQFALDRQAHVSFQIVSVNGNILQTIDQGTLAEGNYSIPLKYNGLSNAVYFVRLFIDDKYYSSEVVR